MSFRFHYNWRVLFKFHYFRSKIVIIRGFPKKTITSFSGFYGTAFQAAVCSFQKNPGKNFYNLDFCDSFWQYWKMKEEWKQIPNWPTFEASTLGQIRRTTTKRVIKQYSNNKRKGGGYKWVSVYRPRESANCPSDRNVSHRYEFKQKYVHRLVMETFSDACSCCEHCGTQKEVNHKDGNRHNNRLDNLEYVTRQENIDRYADMWKEKNKAYQQELIERRRK